MTWYLKKVCGMKSHFLKENDVVLGKKEKEPRKQEKSGAPIIKIAGYSMEKLANVSSNMRKDVSK